MKIDLKTRQKKDEQIKQFFVRKQKESREEFLKEYEESVMEEYDSNALFQWQAAEFEVFERSRKWYLAAALILTAIVSYAVYTNSPLMAITFILIGVVGYIHLQKKPKALIFRITQEGVIVNREIYEFNNMHSFWIFYEPPHIKLLSLRMKGKLIPYIHMPIHKEDPVKIREILLDFVPEVQHEMTLVDTLERLFRL